VLRSGSQDENEPVREAPKTPLRAGVREDERGCGRFLTTSGSDDRGPTGKKKCRPSTQAGIDTGTCDFEILASKTGASVAATYINELSLVVALDGNAVSGGTLTHRRVVEGV